MAFTKKDTRKLFTGLAFLGPNILGFLGFTLIPLVISLFMAFTNWNLEMHNFFRHEPVDFIGFENFKLLFAEKDFYKYLGNTLFFMMGIPFGVGGSLVAAILLSNDFKAGNKRIWLRIVITFVLIVGCGIMVLTGMGATAMTMLICGLVGVVLIGGSIGGQTIYRTLFYFPHFTAGVATFILWKKLYSPETGPINYALRPLLYKLSPIFAAIPKSFAITIAGVLSILIIALCIYGFIRNARLWRDGYAGIISHIIGNIMYSIPLLFLVQWTPFVSYRMLFYIPLAALWIFFAIKIIRGRLYSAEKDKGLSDAVIVCGAGMVVSMILLGFSKIAFVLPEMGAAELQPPKWIADYYWAKPSLMIMGFWAAVGSNNMLLYIAGLSGVSPQLYEAAIIDGATPMQRFWNVTWPQLANVTFFILVMAIIHGLQGGFEMARTMTKGGPFNATTTLSYYIYTEGFATGRLGYASAVSWALFALVFTVTIFNWKFGNKYTND